MKPSCQTIKLSRMYKGIFDSALFFQHCHSCSYINEEQSFERGKRRDTCSDSEVNLDFLLYNNYCLLDINRNSHSGYVYGIHKNRSVMWGGHSSIRTTVNGEVYQQ